MLNNFNLLNMLHQTALCSLVEHNFFIKTYNWIILLLIFYSKSAFVGCDNMRFIRKLVASVLIVATIYMAAAYTLPLFQPYFETAAVLSAGITFWDCGKAIALSQQYAGDDEPFIDTGEFRVNDIADVTYGVPEQEATPPTTSPPPAPPIEASVKPANAGTVIRKTYSAGSTSVYIPVGEGSLKNCTKLGADKINEAISKPPSIKIEANGKPEVLIMHTHATESYQMVEETWFSKEYNSRTTDNTKNMIAVGNKIENELKNAGIGVIHDTTQHDYPSYNGAYERSAVTVKRILKENPSIKIVLDVHRDAIQPDADTMIAPVVTINGKSCAQVMIISGCDNGTMNMPNYMENLKFSAMLQRNMAQSYKGLSRPILFDYRKYNQDLTTGSILLEMGGHANTLDEALYAGELVGKSLVAGLSGL